MNAQHTPGPWVVNTAGSAKRGEPFRVTEIYVYAPETQDDTAICADVIDPVTQEPSEANARLIAAAPDLLAALKLLLASEPLISAATDAELESGLDDEDEAVRVQANAWLVARAAIQKAEGK